MLEAQITGARNAIVNITGGESITLFDAEDAMALVREAAGNDIDAIFGVAINEKLGDSIIVTVIATGFDADKNEEDVLEKAFSYSAAKAAPKQSVKASEPEVYATSRMNDAEEDDNEGIPSFFTRR